VKSFLKEKINEQIHLYKMTPSRMISDYNQENQQVRDYNGRQLLELIQNADDEGADVVSLEFNSSSRILIVSNSGDHGFSKPGYESLMLSNLSSKKKESYIGNKGLGFRSIINWSESVIVRSNSLDVKFSKKYATKLFEEHFSTEEKTRLRSQQGLSENEAPWAVLSVPECSVAPASSWATQVIINYRKNEEKYISEQIRSLSKEVLLFLNNLKKLKLTADGVVTEYILKKNNDNYEISGDSWKIYDSGKLSFPDKYQDKTKLEKQHYNLKIALPNKPLTFESKKLFSFFPTKIELDFPFIIHGTFDLDSSRNQLNDTSKNRYVLQQLVKLIIRVAKDASDKEVSWVPFNVLSYHSINTVLAGLDFYTKISKAKSELDIYPCIDGSYRKHGDYVYMGNNNFSELLIDTCGEAFFPEVLIPLDEKITSVVEQFPVTRMEDYRDRVNHYSEYLVGYPIKNRVDYISEIVKWKDGHDKYNLLINTDGKLINAVEEEVFTPITSNIDNVVFPSFVKIEFINQDLCNRLIDIFNIGHSERYRDLQRELKKVTNIRSYEPAELLSKIVSSTNKMIKYKNVEENEYIAEMTLCLYLIYQQLGISRPKRIGNAQVNLINKRGQIKKSSSLHLSSSYPTGDIVELIFANVYCADDLLAPSNIFDLNDEDIHIQEEFFKWLGVNSYVSYQLVTTDNSYSEHLKRINNVDIRGLLQLQALGINHDLFNSIAHKCKPEQIILWVLKDLTVKNRIQENVNDTVKFETKGDEYGSYKHSLPNITPYLLYQFNQSGLFNDFWISGEKIADLFNDIAFDYEFLYQYGYTKPDIDSILLKLGAKDNFNKLSINHISNILKKLPATRPNGADTQKIYKLVLNHFKENNKPIESDIMLFAKTKTQENYFGQADIFYSDNIRLPSKIIKDKPILNFPKRSGGKQVPECFSVKNLNEIKIRIDDFKIVKTLSSEFERKMQRLKPYLLSYRFDNLQASQKSTESKLISNKNLILCSEISCTCESSQISLNDSDYIQDGNNFYIKVDEERTIENILRDSSFGDTFAEIICSIFKVNEHKNDFRNILRDDEQDIEHHLRNEMGSEILEEARKYLGISDRFVSFWSSIFIHKNIKPTFDIVRTNANLIEEALALQNINILDIDYDNFSRDSIDSIIELFSVLSVNIQQFNKHSGYKLLLADWHYNKFSTALKLLFKDFKFILWEKVSINKDIKDAKVFLTNLHKYDQLDNWAKFIANENTEKTDIEHSTYIKNKVESEFSIKLCPVDESNISEPDRLFQNNINTLKINHSDLPNQISSLLYFDCYLDEITVYLKGVIEKEIIEGAYSDDITISEIPDKPSKTAAINGGKRKGSSAGGRKFSPASDKNKRISGQTAEEVVYHSLVAKYGEKHVDHCSLRSDTFGYDISYSPDRGKSRKLVEVKRFTQSMFYLSENEHRVAIERKKDYQIFLVDAEDAIFIIDEIDFDNDRDLTINPSEYKVYLKLTD
jgi:hypothetical protein